MKKQRPVNLDLRTIQFPITAVASILHRVSGVITFIAIGILLWLLGKSLASPESFIGITNLMNSLLIKLLLWGLVIALVYHILGGIRHMLMDFGFIEETLSVGKFSANLVIALTIILSILTGVWLW